MNYFENKMILKNFNDCKISIYSSYHYNDCTIFLQNYWRYWGVFFNIGPKYITIIFHFLNHCTRFFIFLCVVGMIFVLSYDFHQARENRPRSSMHAWCKSEFFTSHQKSCGKCTQHYNHQCLQLIFSFLPLMQVYNKKIVMPDWRRNAGVTSTS